MYHMVYAEQKWWYANLWPKTQAQVEGQFKPSTKEEEKEGIEPDKETNRCQAIRLQYTLPSSCLGMLYVSH